MPGDIALGATSINPPDTVRAGRSPCPLPAAPLNRTASAAVPPRRHAAKRESVAVSGAAGRRPGEDVPAVPGIRHEGDGTMNIAMALPGNSDSTFLTHLLARGLEDERYVVERFQAMADGDIRRCPGDEPAKKARRNVAPARVGTGALRIRAGIAVAASRLGSQATERPSSPSRFTVRVSWLTPATRSSFRSQDSMGSRLNSTSRNALFARRIPAFAGISSPARTSSFPQMWRSMCLDRARMRESTGSNITAQARTATPAGRRGERQAEQGSPKKRRAVAVVDAASVSVGCPAASATARRMWGRCMGSLRRVFGLGTRSRGRR